MNKDDKRRQEILGLDIGSKYDCHRFETIIERLQVLDDEGFLDHEDAQNCAPTVGEFLEFLRENPQFKALCYIITPNRSDYRLAIEGLTYSGKTTKQMLSAFSNFAHGADEFEASENSLYAWWD